METTTIEVSNTTRNILQQLATESGESIEFIVEKAIEQYRRQRFLEAANKAYTALRNNPEAWAEEIAEREAWDVTLADGLAE